MKFLQRQRQATLIKNQLSTPKQNKKKEKK